MPLSYILWDQDPILFNINISDFHFEARWYGLFFALAFVVGQAIMARIFKAEGKTEKQLESLTLYMILATVLGARLGHCLFYESDYYLSHPLEILKVWKGGLASHGATIGIIAALYFWGKKEKVSWLWILDRIVIVVALGGAFIRLGNLMNSEIVGKPTDASYGFVFAHAGREAIQVSSPGSIKSFTFNKIDSSFITEGGDPRVVIEADFTAPGGDPMMLRSYAEHQMLNALFQYDEAHEHFRPEDLKPNVAFKEGKMAVKLAAIPRHPAQLYEALSCLVLFLALYWEWSRRKAALPEGRLFGAFVVILFSLRFAYEFLKENQVEFEEEMAFNLGQLLSVPMILFGVYILARSYRKKMTSNTGETIS
jgi:prolipoprotein diacylglyceryl transferase